MFQASTLESGSCFGKALATRIVAIFAIIASCSVSADCQSPVPTKEEQLSKSAVIETLRVYEQAWEQQDSELIITVFTEDAVISRACSRRTNAGA